jgi:transcriptional regulator with XRE-family HTH domain
MKQDDELWTAQAVAFHLRRVKAGIILEQLAPLIGTSISTLSRWECLQSRPAMWETIVVKWEEVLSRAEKKQAENREAATERREHGNQGQSGVSE